MDGEISHADGWADAPPIFFLKHQKENAPRPVEKKKCSAGRSAPAQTSCRRRGKVGSPSRQSGTETRCPWGDLWPGEVRDTSSFSFRCRWPVVDESLSIGMQQLLRPPGQRVATAQPLAALPLTDAACPLRASGTRGRRNQWNTGDGNTGSAAARDSKRGACQMRSCTPTRSAPSATGRQYRPGRRP